MLGDAGIYPVGVNEVNYNVFQWDVFQAYKILDSFIK
jgi:hypothetical protein